MKHPLRFRHQMPSAGSARLAPCPMRTVCSWCGRVRGENGCWSEYECSRQPEIISHTACPACYAEAIPCMIREIGEMNDTPSK